MICKPAAASDRTADSRPGPGPLTLTSTCLIPCSRAAFAQASPATWAANGVAFLAPLYPNAPAELQAMAFPCSSVMVTIVLLNVA